LPKLLLPERFELVDFGTEKLRVAIAVVSFRLSDPFGAGNQLYDRITLTPSLRWTGMKLSSPFSNRRTITRGGAPHHSQFLLPDSGQRVQRDTTYRYRGRSRFPKTRILNTTCAYACCGQKGNSIALLGKIRRFGNYTKTTATQRKFTLG